VRLFLRIAAEVMEGEVAEERVAAVWLCAERVVERLIERSENEVNAEKVEEKQVVKEMIKSMAAISLLTLRKLQQEREPCLALMSSIFL
jgi:hypothetical protein